MTTRLNKQRPEDACSEFLNHVFGVIAMASAAVTLLTVIEGRNSDTIALGVLTTGGWTAIWAGCHGLRLCIRG